MRARLAGALALALLPAPAFAAALEGEAQRQPINWVAIAMFVAFVGLTLWITKAAAARTRNPSEAFDLGVLYGLERCEAETAREKLSVTWSQTLGPAF